MKSEQAKISVNPSAHGKGVFATSPIATGEEILVFGGKIFKESELPVPYESGADEYIQIDEEIYLGPSGEADDFVNHSCDPNSGIQFLGQRIVIVALRIISEGEEITIDYSTTMDEDDWELKCACGSSACRGLVKDFSKLPLAVQDKYLELEIVAPFLAQRHKTLRRKVA